jgi:hypothetical protein
MTEKQKELFKLLDEVEELEEGIVNLSGRGYELVAARTSSTMFNSYILAVMKKLLPAVLYKHYEEQVYSYRIVERLLNR